MAGAACARCGSAQPRSRNASLGDDTGDHGDRVARRQTARFGSGVNCAIGACSPGRLFSMCSNFGLAFGATGTLPLRAQRAAVADRATQGFEQELEHRLGQVGDRHDAA
jgi:hypothetical protein